MEPLRVLAAPRRMQILQLVWERELAAGEIAGEFDVSWSAISQHLTVLREAGFVLERRVGTSRRYRADQAALGPLRAVVEQHWRDGLGRMKQLAEAEQQRTGAGPEARRAPGGRPAGARRAGPRP